MSKSGASRELLPSRFINECERALGTKPAKPTTNGFVPLPHVKGVSEGIVRLLKQQSIQVSYKPQRTINSHPTVHHLE